MTREEIMAMVPGRELDCLVAEKVMGWERRTLKRTNIGTGETDIVSRVEKKIIGYLYIGEDRIPEYSTEIKAAWEVVEHMNASGMPIILENGGKGGKYVVEYCNKDRIGTVGLTVADTAPHAICLASLLAVMEVEK